MGLNHERVKRTGAGVFTMKRYSMVIACIGVILGFNPLCLANPLSNIMLLFQKDLVIEISYKNHKNLIQGSKVYLAEDPKDQTVLIGEVRKVSLDESQMARVEIVIHKQYKEKIYQTTPFVLMGNVFTNSFNPYIVAILAADAPDKTPLEPGAVVNGMTYLEYKLAMAAQEVKKVMERVKQQNKELVTQLEKYLDTFDIDAFQKKMNELGNQVSQFSAQQKEDFKNEVLPSLRKMFDSIRKQLEEQNNMEKSKDLEKQLKEIEKMVEV